mmetsp:Transcript_8185/g.19747  ORF Transcript_8185/g.19747 Transcript_8185/m.19747 type:complete len:117 (-) Transcript_8185:496-846(-)
MPTERQHGVGPNQELFFSTFIQFTGREISEHTARLWAVDYLTSKDSNWEPPFPTAPMKLDPAATADQTLKHTKATIEYNAELKDYEEHIGGKWKSVKLAIWSTILGQCSPKLRGQI